jgi:DNA modification methylase
MVNFISKEDSNTNIKNMDCLDFIKTIKEDSVDLILTDPPWDVAKKEYEIGNGLELVVKLLPDFKRIMRVGRHLLFDLSFQTMFDFHKEISKYFTYRQPIILYCNNQMGHRSFAGWNHFRTILWYCTNREDGTPTPIITRYRDVIEFPMKTSKNEDWKYPNPKNVESYKTLIRMFSKENDVVFDPFLGSGTTAIASSLENRKFIGCELNTDYYNIAIKRICNIKLMNSIDKEDVTFP